VTNSKRELMEQRYKLIEQLKGETDPKRIISIQGDLSIVNAEIKKLNITEAAENQRNATVKRTIGQAQHEADIARANTRIMAGDAFGGSEPFGFQPKLEAARAEQKFLTRGEFLLKNAKQMLRTIEKLKRKEPHTVAFEQPLREFIEAQTAHCKKMKERPPRPKDKEDEIEWNKTWSED